MVENLKTIEVEKIKLEGIVELVEPLSEDWHKKYREGYDEKFYKIKFIYQNPFDESDPMIVEDWPISEEYAKTLIIGNKIESDFVLYQGNIYDKYTISSGHNEIDVLRGISKNSEPLIECLEAIIKNNRI